MSFKRAKPALLLVLIGTGTVIFLSCGVGAPQPDEFVPGGLFADAGPDVTVPSNVLVPLNGLNSLDDGTNPIISYEWTVLPPTAVSLINPNNPIVTFMSGVGPATINIQLEVRDTSGASDTDTVTVTVNAPVPMLQRSEDANIVFSSNRDDLTHGDIYTADAQGSLVRALTTTPGVSEFGPTWSPGRSRVGFLRAIGSVADLYVMDVGPGGVERRVTFFADEPEPPLLASASWAPDGKRMVMNVGGNVQLVDVDETSATYGQITPLTSDGNARSPVFSQPAGLQIAWASGGAIWTMNVDGSTPPAELVPAEWRMATSGRLPMTEVPVTDLAWSNLGSHIAFVRLGRIYTVAVAGRLVVPVTAGTSGYSGVAWSQDDRRLVTSYSDAPEISRLMVVNSDGQSPPQEIPGSIGQDKDADW